MATELAKAYVQIIPSAQGISGSIAQVLEPESQKAGESSGNAFAVSFGGMLKTALSTSVEAITGVTSALIDGAMQTASYGDEISKTAQKLGVSSSFYQEWEAVLQHSGTSMDAVGSSFKKLADAAQNASADQVEAFQKLGISIEELPTMSAEEIFENVVFGLQGMEEGTERTSLAIDLLGKGAMELGPLFNSSAEDVQGMIETVRELGGVMDNDAISASESFQDSLQDMNTVIDGLKTSVLSDFLPALTSMMDGITSIFSGNGDQGIGQIVKGVNQLSVAITNNAPTLISTATTLISSLSQALIMNLPLLVDSASEIVNGIGQLISENGEALSDGVVALLGAFVDLIVQNVPILLEAGVQLILGLAESLAENVDTMIPSIIELIGELVQILIDNEPLLVTAALDLVVALADGLLQGLPTLISMLPELISGLVTGITEHSAEIIEAGVQLLTALVEDLPAIINAIVEVIPDIIIGMTSAFMDAAPDITQAGIDLFIALLEDIPAIQLALSKGIMDLIKGIIDKFKDAWPDMKQAGYDMFININGKISDAIPEIVAKAGEIVDNIVEALKDGWESLKEVGSFLVEGLVSGIDDMVAWAVEKVSAFGDSIVEGLKDFFGIASPSKVFAEIGEFCVQGFDKPFENFGDKALEEVQNTINELGRLDESEWLPSVNASLDASLNANPYNNNDMYLLMDMLGRYLPVIAENQINFGIEADEDSIFRVVQNKNAEFKRRNGYDAFA